MENLTPIKPILFALSLVAVAAAQDPTACRANLDARLAGHPFFTRVTFSVVDRHPPFLFYLQRPPRDDAEYDRKIVNSILPFLQELTRQCEARYWKPAGLQRSADAPAFAVAVLDSSDIEGLGVTGKVTKLDDGRVEVDYSAAGTGCSFDCTPVDDLERSPVPMPEVEIAYSGPTGFAEANGKFGLVGSGQLRWVVPMGGPQIVEFEFVLHDAGSWGVMLCTEGSGCLLVDPMCAVFVLDKASHIADVVNCLVEDMVFIGRRYTMRIERDGKQNLVVKRNGKVMTQVSNIGQRLCGEVRFFVHSSTPLTIGKLEITGRPETEDLGPLRERYVQSVLAEIWR
jgi:hypothetical protein